MAQLIGTITRKVGNTIVEAQQTAQGNVGCFVARTGDGAKIGDFRNLTDARRAVQRAFGSQLRWAREDLRGSIEHWVARGPLSDPLDIYGIGNLLEWNEMDVGVQVAAGTSNIALVGDQSTHLANMTQTTSAQQPTLADSGLAGRPTAVFDPATNENISAPATLDPTSDLTITMMASINDTTVERHLLNTQLVGAPDVPLTVLVDPAGDFWGFSNSLGPALSAIPAVLNQPYCVQLVYRVGPPTFTALYVNNVLAVSNAGTFDAATPAYLGGEPGVNSWSGRGSLYVVARDSSEANRALMFAYASKRYLQ